VLNNIHCGSIFFILLANMPALTSLLRVQFPKSFPLARKCIVGVNGVPGWSCERRSEEQSQLRWYKQEKRQRHGQSRSHNSRIFFIIKFVYLETSYYVDQSILHITEGWLTATGSVARAWKGYSSWDEYLVWWCELLESGETPLANTESHSWLGGSALVKTLPAFIHHLYGQML